MKKALITGITGQDGSYLAEHLLDKGYEVHGLVRRVALEDPEHRLGRITHLRGQLHLHPGVIETPLSLLEAVEKVNPEEVYHLAAQSFVHESFVDGGTTFSMNNQGAYNMLSAVLAKAPNARFYFAGSSEMFGKVEEVPQTERTKFHPRSPYGISKVAGFDLTRLSREAYKLFACTGILFNHESPRRGKEFVTRKITSQLAEIKKTGEGVLALGNLEAKRDWGYARDYVEAMHLMLQQEEPNDYVIATGETRTVREFVELAAKSMDLDLVWRGEGIDEIGCNGTTGNIIVKIDQKFYRPAEVDLLLGDPSKAKREFGWTPNTKFEDLVCMMARADLEN